MSTESKPMTYLSMKAVVPHMIFSQSFRLSLGSPLVNSIFKRLPLNIKTLRVDRGEVEIDDGTYKFKRLMSFKPVEETDFIQFIVNNNRSSLIRTKAPVEVVVKMFLEMVFSGKSVNVETWEIGSCPISNINLHVENVVFLGNYCESVMEKMVSRDSFPLKTAEIANWVDVPQHIDTEMLIVPFYYREMEVIRASSNYRIHLECEAGNVSRDPKDFLRSLLREFEVNIEHRETHWSFNISTNLYNKFVEWIHWHGRFNIETRDGQYRVTCGGNPDLCLYVQTVRDKETPDEVILHLIFDEI